MIKLGEELSRDCITLERRIGNWSADLKAKLRAVHREVGVRWKGEAVKRVPVDTGFLKSKILSNVYQEQELVYVTEVGTNVPEYPVDLEFGTKYIARGAVLRLGDSTNLTDQDAIHMWPAKQADAIKSTSYSINTNDERLNKIGELAGANKQGGPQEQMPWLRPAFNSIRQWVIDSLNNVVVVPPNPGP